MNVTRWLHVAANIIVTNIIGAVWGSYVAEMMLHLQAPLVNVSTPVFLLSVAIFIQSVRCNFHRH